MHCVAGRQVQGNMQKNYADCKRLHCAPGLHLQILNVKKAIGFLHREFQDEKADITEKNLAVQHLIFFNLKT